LTESHAELGSFDLVPFLQRSCLGELLLRVELQVNNSRLVGRIIELQNLNIVKRQSNLLLSSIIGNIMDSEVEVILVRGERVQLFEDVIDFLVNAADWSQF
jgi:hypothetical protein